MFHTDHPFQVSPRKFRGIRVSLFPFPTRFNTVSTYRDDRVVARGNEAYMNSYKITTKAGASSVTAGGVMCLVTPRNCKPQWGRVIIGILFHLVATWTSNTANLLLLQLPVCC